MNNFEHRVLRIELINTAVQRLLVGVLKLYRDKKSQARTGDIDVKILRDRVLRIKGSAEHSRCTYVDRPLRSANEQ